MLIALVLLLAHEPAAGARPMLNGPALTVAGVVAGFAIGIVASLLGVAGGELLIPTLVLLFGVGIQVAGSLSLAVSLPTMIAGFVRYSRDSSFAVLARHKRFVIVMAAGSIARELGHRDKTILSGSTEGRHTGRTIVSFFGQSLSSSLNDGARIVEPAWCPAIGAISGCYRIQTGTKFEAAERTHGSSPSRLRIRRIIKSFCFGLLSATSGARRDDRM